MTKDQLKKFIVELDKENRNLKEINKTLQRWLEQTEDMFRFQKEENKKLKERVSELEDVSKDYDLLSKDFITLWEENEKLKEYNWELIENHKKDIAILCEENDKLKEELEWYKEHYIEKVDEEVLKGFNLDKIS